MYKKEINNKWKVYISLLKREGEKKKQEKGGLKCLTTIIRKYK
jgi:hypothetical protein